MRMGSAFLLSESESRGMIAQFLCTWVNFVGVFSVHLGLIRVRRSVVIGDGLRKGRHLQCTLCAANE